MKFISLICLVVVAMATFGTISANASCTKVTQRIDCGDLTCNTTSKHCTFCTDSSECYESGYKCSEGRCVMKSLAENFNFLTVLAAVVAIFISAIAAVSGVGGGAVLVPTYIWLLGLPIGDSVPLAQANILGQAATNALLQIVKHHPLHMPPESTWPLINYEYLVLLLPPLMVGTLVGGLGNAVSPGWFRVVLLISMQVVVLYRSVKKAIAQREKDRAAAHSVIVHEYSSYFFVNGKPEVDPEDVRGSRGYASMAVRRTLVLNNEGEYTSTLDDKEAPQKCCSLVPHQYHYGNYFRDYKPQYPWRLMLIALFVFSITLAFVAASSNTLNIVECNSVGYWLILVGAIAFAIVAVATIRAYLAYLNCLAANCDVHCNVVPFRWNKFTTVGFPMFAFIAGAAASMLGSGSGMILNFVLLEADLLPEEVSATGGVATTLVAAQAVIVFILQGNLSWDFGLYVIAAGIVSALIGQFCLIRPIKKRGLTFLFIVSLVVIMVCSLGSLTAYGIYETIEIVSVGGSLMFGSLCD